MARAELTTRDSYAKAFQAHNIISLDSSDDERPPQDEVIRKSLQRQQHGLKGNGRKRKAPSPDSPDVIQLSASSSDAGRASPGEGSGSDMSFGSDAQNGAASPQQQLLRGPGSARTIVFSAGPGARKQRAGNPKGVIVVEEGALPERNSEVKRLLRGSRYFDDDLGEIGSGPRCYRCGQRGHLAAACSNEPKQVPCSLCAQFGHNKANCPSLLCYRCNRPGHIARDCPNPAAAKGHVCLRCGRWDCASAGSGDYLRAEGNCTNEYDPEDLQHVRCYVCNQWGHVCCKGAPTEVPVLSCHNCGEQGHLAEECWMTRPTQVGMERQADYSRGGGSRYTPPQPYDRYQSGSYDAHHTGSGSRYADRVQAFANGTRAGGSDRQPYSRGWGREHYNAVPYDYQEPAGGRYRRY